MKRRIVMTQRQHETLSWHFASERNERLAFMFAGVSQSKAHMDLLVRDIRLVSASELTGGGKFGLELCDKTRSEVFCRAAKEHHAVIEAHSHPWAARRVAFSRTDDEGEESLLPYLNAKLSGQPYGSIVWGNDCVNARLWLPPLGKPIPIDTIRIVGTRIWDIIPTHSARTQTAVHDERFYKRQIIAFGSAGQACLRATHVGIVGLGGIGSHMAQQLSYLGIGEFTLVDDDSVETSNLNRLIGATPADVGRPKVEVSRRLIEAISPKARVHAFHSSLMRQQALEALRSIDLLVGCTDTDGSRLVLNELAKTYLMPYVDCGVSIAVESERINSIGGRVVVVLPDGPCLHCAQEIDRVIAGQELESDVEKDIRRKHGYVAGASIEEPSVVSLNGVVGSIAAGEIIALATGWRDPVPFQVYYGDGRPRSCVQRKVNPMPRCWLCSTRLGKGDDARLNRYDRRSLPQDMPK